MRWPNDEPPDVWLIFGIAFFFTILVVIAWIAATGRP